MAKSIGLQLGDSILRTLQVCLQSLWRNWPAKQSNSVKKMQNKEYLRRSRSFKVIEVSINRNSVCDFLLVINSNWHTVSYRFGVIAAYCSNFRHFAFSYKNLDRFFFRFVTIYAFDRQTDGWTDGQRTWERVPYLSALEEYSRPGAIQIHVCLCLTEFSSLDATLSTCMPPPLYYIAVTSTLFGFYRAAWNADAV